MRALRGLQLALVAAGARGGLGEDAFALIQQSLGSTSGLGLVGALHAGQGRGYKLGDSVQVHFEGTNGWVDCSINGPGNMPDSYDIHVPTMSDGLLQDRTFKDVPSVMLRKVYKGFDVNIEQGLQESAWVPCMLLDKRGENYVVELMDLRPGFIIQDVPPSLLREGEDRKQKAARLREMIEENEAQKADLFYMAKVKTSKAHVEVEEKKRQKEEEDRRYAYMQQYVWQEMARRAEKENTAPPKPKKETFLERMGREGKERREKKEQEEAIERAKKLEEDAKTDPVAALMLKAKKASQALHKVDEQMKARSTIEAEEQERYRETQKQLADQRAREIEENMLRLKQEHEALKQRLAAAGATPAPSTPVRSSWKAWETLELEQRKSRRAMADELRQVEVEEDRKYQEEEVHRKSSVGERRKVIVRKQLDNAARAFNEDESKNKRNSLRDLYDSVIAAGDAGLEAEVVDPLRVTLVKEISDYARGTVANALKSETLADAQSALKNLPGKAHDIDVMWSGIQDSLAKWNISPFQESELSPLKEKLPELVAQEVKFTALRAAIDLAKVNVNAMREAIDKAEAGGLPAKEIEAARARLRDRETKPLLIKNIEEARKAGDVERLAAAIAEGEAANLGNGLLHSARHALKELQEQH